MHHNIDRAMVIGSGVMGAGIAAHLANAGISVYLVDVVPGELLPEEDDSTPSVARFWATSTQMRAFSIRGQEVVAAGRPKCTMCGEPMDPEGHFCPRKNGHRT